MCIQVGQTVQPSVLRLKKVMIFFFFHRLNDLTCLHVAEKNLFVNGAQASLVKLGKLSVKIMGWVDIIVS